MINDKELRKYFRELFYMCDHFFSNSYEQRFVICIIEKAEEIEEYILKHYPNDQYLNDIKAGFPLITKTELDKLSRSKKEKIISGFLFFLVIPAFTSRIFHANPDDLDNLKRRSEYLDKTREKERNLVSGKIAEISKLTIRALGKIR